MSGVQVHCVVFEVQLFQLLPVLLFLLEKRPFKTKISVAAGVIALLLCAFTNIGNIELVGLGVGSVVIWQLFSVVNKKMKKKVKEVEK